MKVNPIEAAVLPLKEEAIERAEQFAKGIVAGVRKELKAANYDLHIAAPYPKSFGMNRVEFFVAVGKYELFQKLTVWRDTPGPRGMHDPCYADVNSNKVTKFIKQAKEDAAAQYDLFVCKLVEKIGPVKDATLTGNHVWSYSYLLVTLPSGERQNWKTQQIINVSKLGKVFNQWPTRKVKK